MTSSSSIPRSTRRHKDAGAPARELASRAHRRRAASPIARSRRSSGSTSAPCARSACVAERDTYDLAEWEKAIEFKRKAARESAALTLKRPDLKDS